MNSCDKGMRGGRASDCSNLPRVEVGSVCQISSREGKLAVLYYDNVSKTKEGNLSVGSGRSSLRSSWRVPVQVIYILLRLSEGLLEAI